MIWTKESHQSAKFHTFDCSHEISPNLDFDRLLLLKEKLTCGLENDMRSLANFYQSTRKSQNWNFDWIFLSKVENE